MLSSTVAKLTLILSRITERQREGGAGDQTHPRLRQRLEPDICWKCSAHVQGVHELTRSTQGPPKDVQTYYAKIPGSYKLPGSSNYYVYVRPTRYLDYPDAHQDTNALHSPVPSSPMFHSHSERPLSRWLPRVSVRLDDEKGLFLNLL